jgi:glycerophosphoryl diester phosphodiesterase
MTAYRNAARIGVDDFETDSYLSSDGVLVLIHDATLDRTTNCSGSVTAKTLAELRQCDAGYWYSPGQSITKRDESLPHPLRGKGVVIPPKNCSTSPPASAPTVPP